MKKLFLKSLMLGIIFISGFGFAQQNKAMICSSVTTEEYQKLDANGKRLADYITTAISSLVALQLNAKNYTNYEVMISFSTDEKKILRNTISTYPKENSEETDKHSCVVSGVRSAYHCLQQMQDTTSGDFDVHVHQNGDGSVTLSWP